MPAKPHKLFLHRVASIGITAAGLLLAGLTSLFLHFPAPSYSAEQITVKYEGKEYSLSIEEIEKFLLTGEISAPLPPILKNNPLLRLTAMQILYQDIPLSLISKASTPKLLESLTSELVLSQIGQIIRPRGDGDSQAALRTALDGSIRQGKFNPMRFIKSFPDREIIIDVDRWGELHRLFSGIN